MATELLVPVQPQPLQPTIATVATTMVVNQPPSRSSGSDMPLLEDEMEHYDQAGVERYERLDGMIGEGTYGQVYRARDRRTGRIVAQKKLGTHNALQRIVLRELSILRHVQHYPTIVSLLNVVIRSPGRLELITEFLPTNLFSFYMEEGRGCPNKLMPMAGVKGVMWQLLQTLQALKDRCVLHRDLKPSNILVDVDKYPTVPARPLQPVAMTTPAAVPPGIEVLQVPGQGIPQVGRSDFIGTLTSQQQAEYCVGGPQHVSRNLPFGIKVCDFGSARMAMPEDPYEPKTVNTPTGTCSPCWRAPELYLGSTYYGHAADMWSVGCMFAELLTGEVLFLSRESSNDFDFLRLILRQLGSPKTREEWYPLFQGYSEKMCNPGESPDEALAMTIEQSMELPKFPGSPLSGVQNGLLGQRAGSLGVDLISRMLTLSPVDRISVEDALRHPFFENI